MARHLETVLPMLGHPGQTGFVKHRLSSHNMGHLLHIIHLGQTLSPPCALLFVEVEKAFDRIPRSEGDTVSVKATIHKTSLYADDLLIYLDQVLTPKEFWSISGCKINLKKHCLLPLNSTMNTTNTNLYSGIPMVSNFRYLGLNIYSSLDKIVTKKL